MDKFETIRFKIIETCAHESLKLFGFRKQKMSWRRVVGEVLQQFSIVGMNVGRKYRPEWGLNILRRIEDRRPIYYTLQVRWIFEMTVENLPERLNYFACFDLQTNLSDDERAAGVKSSLKSFVVPSFEAISTEEHVKAMIGNINFPLRAQSYFRLPDEWWPDDPASEHGVLPPAVVRPFDRAFNPIEEMRSRRSRR